MILKNYYKKKKQDIMSNFSSKDSSDNKHYDIKEVNTDDNMEIFEKPIVQISTPVETIILKKKVLRKFYH